LDRIATFAAKCDVQLDSVDAPHLIIIQNFCPEPESEQYNIDISTQLFQQSLYMPSEEENQRETQTKEKVAEVIRDLCKFKSVACVKIPDASKNPRLYDNQIQMLKVTKFLYLLNLKNYLSHLFHVDNGFTLNKDNFFSSKLWFQVIRELVHRFNNLKDCDKISIAEVFYHICKPKAPLLKST
jgi:hypothetical protein